MSLFALPKPDIVEMCMNSYCCFSSLASRLLLLASCLLTFLTACAPQPLTVTPEPVVLRLVAANSCVPLTEQLIAAYEKAYPWVTVELIGAFNSAVAERSLRAGEADVALLSWPAAEVDGEALWSQPFARHGVAVVAHPSNSFTETDLGHLQAIYRGRIQEWDGVTLTAISREEGSGLRAVFDSVVLDRYDVTHTAVVMSSNEAILEYVARTPGAIGYASAQLARNFSGVRVLPVEGVSPTQEAVSEGSYPFSHSFYLATIGQPAGASREFAQWVLGPQGRAVVRQR